MGKPKMILKTERAKAKGKERKKFWGNEGEFSMWIFPPPFPVESLGISPRGNFSRASLKNFKMQFIDIGRVPVM